MPSGKTHDAVTFLLLPAIAAAAYVLSRDLSVTLLSSAAFLFGGLMFGPDLDTNSKQYARWWIFRPLWLPYRIFFNHRSRWTHGLLISAILRVIYFMGVLTLGTLVAAYIVTASIGGEPLFLADFLSGWASLGDHLRQTLGMGPILAVFAGLWAGAASHTLTDLAGSFIKTGRAGKAL